MEKKMKESTLEVTNTQQIFEANQKMVRDC